MKKKSILLLIAYLCVVFAVYLTSSTLTKYVTTLNPTGDYNLGERLLVNYERGQLYRNDQLIVGVEIDEGEEGADGEIATKRRIETMNVAPSDILIYHFYVSNYDEKTTLNPTTGKEEVQMENGKAVIADFNTVDGQFHVSATSILSMPAHRQNYTLSCILSYRRINADGSTGVWMDFPSDIDVDLPIYDSTNPLLYEFKVQVLLDDQITTTSSDEYVGATLSIHILVDAADKI